MTTIMEKMAEIQKLSDELEVLMHKGCAKCDGTGIMQVPNGEDDFDHDFCTCACGQNAEHIAHNEMIAHAQ